MRKHSPAYSPYALCSIIALLLSLAACRGPEEIIEAEIITVSTPEYTEILGFYLLNEGNMGSNKATLDYYDYQSGQYTRNLYAEANPTVAKELGDVGNDLKVYGSRLYAVINCSNKIEVMNLSDATRIGQVDIPNCRYLRFHEGYAYATSYAGPVKISPTYEQIGYVAKIDTATLQIVDTCLVGYQPDELEIANGKIYVANSGGYMYPNYESTVSVVDMESFTEINRIEVAINLHHLRLDKHQQLWVSSRGDYYTIPSRLYCIDLNTDILIDSIDVAVSNFWLDGDSLYFYSTEWSYVSMSNQITYGIINVNTHQLITTNFITDGTDQNITVPYGIMVNPLTKDIYVTDAKNYVNPGTLYCFSQEGTLKWSVTTGDIPAHFALVGK